MLNVTLPVLKLTPEGLILSFHNDMGSWGRPPACTSSHSRWRGIRTGVRIPHVSGYKEVTPTRGDEKRVDMVVGVNNVEVR